MKTPEEAKLHWGWRLGLTSLAVVLTLLAACVLFDGVLVLALGGSQTQADAVADPQTSVVVSLLAAAAVLLLLAANGRRVLSAKFGDNELKLDGGPRPDDVRDDLKAVATEATAGDSSSGDTEAGDKQISPEPPQCSRTVDVDGRTLAYVEADDLPVRVVHAVLGEILLNHANEVPDRLSDIEYGARSTGRGNHPWFVKFRRRERIWKVAFGGQGKTTPTVTLEKAKPTS